MKPKIHRTCGECTACCKTHGVLSLLKPTGVMCKHCTGTGCGIYLERPPECRNFTCLWLEGAGDEMCRPDLTGVVLQYQQILGLDFVSLAVWEFREGALEESFATEWSRRELEDAYCVVHAALNGDRTLYLPPRVDHPAEEYIDKNGKRTKVIPFAQSKFARSRS
jgi:hypothetical protein